MDTPLGRSQVEGALLAPEHQLTHGAAAQCERVWIKVIDSPQNDYERTTQIGPGLSFGDLALVSDVLLEVFLCWGAGFVRISEDFWSLSEFTV